MNGEETLKQKAVNLGRLLVVLDDVYVGRRAYLQSVASILEHFTDYNLLRLFPFCFWLM